MEQMDFAAYEREWEESLETIVSAGNACEGLDYFIGLAKEYYKPENLKNRHAKVILLDMSFPAEIIRALGVQPLYLPGGSFIAANWAENMVPRDTDSVVKSVLGMLTNREMDLVRKSIVLVPQNCDSMRKFPDMLREYDCTVIPVELPSSKTSENLRSRWENEVRGVTQQLERKLKRRLRTSALRTAWQQSEAAREAYRRLDDVCTHHPGVISGAVRLFIANAYLWETDPQKWISHVNALTDEVCRKKREWKVKPQILVVGSPVYFPNYKLPFLLESLEMDMAVSINPVTAHLLDEIPETALKGRALIGRAAQYNLAADISPAFVENDTLFEYMKKTVREKSINGAILHIVKGQIEYDFEMRRYEEYLEQKGIPIFRLETDYNYQDLEQLRIRLEAFSEMTAHKMMLSEERSA